METQALSAPLDPTPAAGRAAPAPGSLFSLADGASAAAACALSAASGVSAAEREGREKEASGSVRLHYPQSESAPLKASHQGPAYRAGTDSSNEKRLLSCSFEDGNKRTFHFRRKVKRRACLLISLELVKKKKNCKRKKTKTNLQKAKTQHTPALHKATFMGADEFSIRVTWTRTMSSGCLMTKANCTCASSDLQKNIPHIAPSPQ